MSKTVSIILPTYNRADTIVRAIKSVQGQTFPDWELIVVDDGSTDGTAELIAALEPRMVLIRQENRGFTEARNVGIKASTGKYLAFLDSDDEFMPHHLELCVSFLEAFPDEQFVSTELLENLGHNRFVRHYRVETAEWYPQRARQIGSHMLDLPSGQTDDYLRVFESREPIEDWGRAIVMSAGTEGDGFLYRGNIFEYFRWGFLITITATVIRRTALDVVGLPQSRLATGSDFHFMASLCRNFRANYLSVPTFIKHELNTEEKPLLLSHVVTGSTALQFLKDLQHAWEELFWTEGGLDSELQQLRGIRLFHIALAALEVGEREVAIQYLREARKNLNGSWMVLAVEGFAICIPNDRISQQLWLGLSRGSAAVMNVFQGQLTLSSFVRKALFWIGLIHGSDSID